MSHWTRRATVFLSVGLSGCLGGTISLSPGPVGSTLRSAPHGPSGLSAVRTERLEYTVAYGGVPAGFLWLEARREGEAATLVGQGGTNAVFDLVYPVRADVRSVLDSRGEPVEFELQYRENGDARLRRLRFDDPVTLSWRDAGGAGSDGLVVDADSAVDPLTFLWLLRERAPTRTEDFEVVAGPRPDLYRVTPLGRAELTVAAGHYPEALAYRVAVRAPDEDDPRASFEVYLDAAPGNVPLLLRRSIGPAYLSVELQARSIPSPGRSVTSPGPATPADGPAE